MSSEVTTTLAAVRVSPASSPLRLSLWVISAVLMATGLALLWLSGSDDPPKDPGSLEGTGALPSADGPAPDFSITLLDGSGFSLSEHLVTDGRPVFLNFWASWCFPCREEMPLLDRAADRHPDVLFLGVAVEDDPDAARAFAEEIGVNYPLAIDESGTVAARYPFFGLPTSWLIDAEGQVVRRVSGLFTEELLEELLRTDLGG